MRFGAAVERWRALARFGAVERWRGGRLESQRAKVNVKVNHHHYVLRVTFLTFLV